MEIVRLVLGPMQVHTYIVKEGDFCAVIDPEKSDGAIAQALSERGWQAGCILLTHAHFDHVRGIDELPMDIPLYVHAADLPYVQGVNRTIWPYRKETAVEHVPQAVADGQQIGPFTVMHVPGHAPGSVLYSAQGHVFSGDALFVRAMPNLGFALSDEQVYAQSLARMKEQLDPHAALHAGHGETGRVQDGFL